MPNQAEAAAAISAADVILLVESDVPWLPATVTLRADVQVFHVDPDPAKASMPLWSYPVDFAVQADGPAALAAIAAELAAIADARARGRPAGSLTGSRGCASAAAAARAGSRQRPAHPARRDERPEPGDRRRRHRRRGGGDERRRPSTRAWSGPGQAP